MCLLYGRELTSFMDPENQMREQPHSDVLVLFAWKFIYNAENFNILCSILGYSIDKNSSGAEGL